MTQTSETQTNDREVLVFSKYRETPYVIGFEEVTSKGQQEINEKGFYKLSFAPDEDRGVTGWLILEVYDCEKTPIDASISWEAV